MRNRPFSLPRSKAIVNAAREFLSDPERHFALLREMRARRVEEIAAIDAIETEMRITSVCGGFDNTCDVECWPNDRGVPEQFIVDHEKPVGHLQWLDLDGRVASPGNVSGEFWCTGALIASDRSDSDLFLTAGHCFGPHANAGIILPRDENDQPLSFAETALLMQVRFNHQRKGCNGNVRDGDPYPITELFECGLISAGIDYAIVRLGKNGAAQLASAKYGTLAVAATDLMTPHAPLCIIQHSMTDPKKFDAGPMYRNDGIHITYGTLDTFMGASGSPVLSLDSGEIVGVHIHGGCFFDQGQNVGQSIGAIRNASTYL